MIKLFKVKKKQKENAESANDRAPIKKQSAGEVCLHKDISELNLPKTCSISFPNGKDDLMNFEVTIRPDEGYYVNQIMRVPSIMKQLHACCVERESKIVCIQCKKSYGWRVRGTGLLSTVHILWFAWTWCPLHIIHSLKTAGV